MAFVQGGFFEQDAASIFIPQKFLEPSWLKFNVLIVMKILN